MKRESWFSGVCFWGAWSRGCTVEQLSGCRHAGKFGVPDKNQGRAPFKPSLTLSFLFIADYVLHIYRSTLAIAVCILEKSKVNINISLKS